MLSLAELNELNLEILTIREVAIICERYCVNAVCYAGKLIGFEISREAGTECET